MIPLSSQAVIGAGPVGCFTALNLAQRSGGGNVTLFEADSRNRNRFAGEWLHPAGIRALCQSGLLERDELETRSVSHRGFAIFPHDRSEAILLEYPGSDRGLVCEHGELVALLRERAVADPNIQFISGARVESVKAGELAYRRSGDSESKIFQADHIIGADGRGSVVRPALGLTRSSRLISYMAGVLLRDIELPHEGFGHVILGAAGPILLYRVAPNLVRASIDVPANAQKGKKHLVAMLREEYAPFLPESIRGEFVRAIAEDELAFRANRYRARMNYGNENLSLVGDAVGFQHPLTAMGMTLGFQDAVGLVDFDDFAEFQKARRSATLVPEMLAMSLFQAFSGRDSGACEVRKAIYSMWRRYPQERERTMRLLSGEVTSPIRFSFSFIRGVQLALLGSVLPENERLQLSQVASTLGSIGQILLGMASCSSARLARSAA